MGTSTEVGSAVASGMGIFGWIILIGLLGFGPCAKTCSGCGPTVKDTIIDIKCDRSAEERNIQ